VRSFGSRWPVLATVLLCVTLAACGGLAEQLDFDDVDSADVFDDDSAFSGSTPGALDAGPVTVFAEPGHAVVTANGRTLDHTPGESGGRFWCSFSEEHITLEVNSEFGSMILRANQSAEGWSGTFTADSDEEGWIQYTAQPFDGELGIDFESEELSYVGIAERHDRDAMADGDFDTPTVDVTVAVNCGIEPATVDVGGQMFTFAPFAASQSTCQISGPDSIDINISYTTEDRRLQFSLRPDGDGVIGGVYLSEGDDKWTAVISTNSGTAEGLSFDGNSVTFTGTFVHTSDADPDLSEDLEGTATATCPG
jgi:hypothetical protein